jgi:hypothetical protein
MVCDPTVGHLANINDSIFEVYLTTRCLGSGIRWELACFATRWCGQSVCWLRSAGLVDCIWLCVVVRVIIHLVSHIQQVVDGLLRCVDPSLKIFCALLG